MTRYRAAPAATLRIEPLDALTLIYHRASGISHLVDSPVPELLDLLAEPLTLDEAREVSRMARRLAELVLLGPDLDASYARVQGDVWAWGAGG